MSVVKRFVCLVAAAVPFFAAPAAVFPESYIEDGLVAHWDAVDNVATGAHDPTAAKWVDKVGGVALEGAFSIDEKTMAPSSDISAGFAGLADLKGYTVETLSCRTDGKGLANSGFIVTPRINMGYTSNGPDTFSVWFTSNASKGNYWGQHYHQNDREKQHGLATRTASYAVRADQPVFYYDGAECPVSSVNGWRGTLTPGDAVKIYSGTTYHSIRIYNRILSAQEVAYNHAVDQLRFFGNDGPFRALAFAVQPIPFQARTGQPVCPLPKVVDFSSGRSVELKSSDYDCSYANNVDLGTATVTVTGRGRYAGFSSEATFRIVPAKRVTAEGSGRGDGSSWADAMTWTNALQYAVTSDVPSVIWVKADTIPVLEDANYSFDKAPVSIRGGFAGTETSEAERPAGAMSVLDAANSCDVFLFSNTVEVEVERMRFLRGKGRGLKRSASSGDLRLVSCDFSFNGAAGACDHETTGGGYYWKNRALGGAGAALYGSGGSRLLISGCTFTGNRQDTQYPGSGIGAFVGGFAQATLCDSLFATNVCGGTETQATALQVYNTRARVERCEFRGNRDGGWPTPGRTVGVHDACDGTEFVNCLFAGNVMADVNNIGLRDDQPGGVVTVTTSSESDTVRFSNCTFAYNYASRYASLVVSKGAVTVDNSIFHRNLVHATQAFRAAHVCLTQTGATCTLVDSCLDSSDGSHLASIVDGTSVVTNNCVSGVDPLFVTSTSDFETLAGAASANRPRGPSLAALSPSALASFDCHLLSSAGYYDNAGALRVSRRIVSPCIDAGNPSVKCVEPKPNGRRVNLGAYGNTPWASRSPGGMAIILR